ncbi:papain like protease [Curtobacterium sp. PhB136]|nr:papain like protease [Curtobacterium sp. PhB136]
MTAQSSKSAGPRGLTPAEAAAALAQPGQPLLSAMPLETSAHAVIAWPAGIASEPWFSAHMKTDSGTGAIRAALAANQIVILGIEVTDAFLDLTTSDGVVDADPTRQRFYELHAVICVGSGRSAADEELFLIRNSWGPYWADGGDGWVTAAFLDEHCRDVMEVDDVYP